MATENPSVIADSAIMSPHDDRDLLFTDVAFGSAPFDWSVGYDGETDVNTFLGQITKIPIKNQNGSGSCGGQSESYGGASLSTFHDNKYEEKSAKFTYAPVAYPGGGSTGRDLSNRSINVGWGSEALTPSYENGNPPSEHFIARKQDITQEAITHASHDKAFNYVLLPLDIDAIAQGIRDYKFARIGVVGSNNGTWYTEAPVPPKDGDTLWYHWVAGMKAKMLNGKKAIGFPNSWGAIVGNNGWQWLTEDWFKAHLTNNKYGAIPIFEPRAYTWNAVPLPPSFHHTFNKDLEYGMIDPENIQLQTALRLDGEFPNGIPYNERFGIVTRTAVEKFQVKYGIVSAGQPGYGRCGPKTRVKLNTLFA